MNYSLQMNKTNIIGSLPVAQPGKPMQPSAHSATSRIKWAVALRMPKPLPLGEPFGYTSTPFYHTFPLATRLNGRKNSQNGQKSRKNACKALCRRPSEPKNTGGKTPESPKIPLQLGCSVTQIRHFFKRTFFNLPLIFENNVKKATVWLHERGAKPLRQCFALPPPLPRGGLGIPRKVNGFARGSPTRGAGGRKPD